ncbi:hypothetical protein EII28_12550, partial [Fusobacterium nucleatum]
PFLVTNNASVFSKLKDTLKDYNKEDVLISTSIYGNNFIKYFYNLGFKITILNPILTNRLRKASIRNAKNDKIDSISIAQTALLCAYSLFKELSRFRRNLKKSIASLKTKLTSYIVEAFP